MCQRCMYIAWVVVSSFSNFASTYLRYTLALFVLCPSSVFTKLHIESLVLTDNSHRCHRIKIDICRFRHVQYYLMCAFQQTAWWL